MNQQYSIVSKGVVLNTYDDLDISLNYELKDYLDITKMATDWSRPFVLPGTPVNNKFFKQNFDVNIDNVSANNNINKKVAAVITTGDNNIFSGYIKLKKVLAEPTEYEIVIYGVLNNIVSSFGDRLLSDLDFKEYDHIRNKENIYNSWSYNIKRNGIDEQFFGPGTGYIYPDIVYGGSTNIETNKYIYDLYPGVYDRTIVNKIFQDIGINVKSDFFDSEYFSMMYLPYVNDKLQLNESDFNKRIVNVGIDTAYDYLPAGPYVGAGSNWYEESILNFDRESGVVDNNGTELTFQDIDGQFSGQYTNDKTGWYDISFLTNAFMEYLDIDDEDINYDEGSGAFEFQWRLFKNGMCIDDSGVLLKTPSTGSHPSPWLDTDAGPIEMSLQADNIFLEVGDVISVVYGYRYPYGVNWIGIGAEQRVMMRLNFKRVLGNVFSLFSVKPASNNSQGGEMITVSNMLPLNYKIVDYFADLVKQFNLVIVEDDVDDRTIIIEPEDYYFSSKQLVLNWDKEEKLDIGSEEITPMSELDATKYYFTYGEDDDFYNKQYTNETKKVYGEITIDVENDNSNVTNSTELKLSPTPCATKWINGRVSPFFCDIEDEKFVQKKVKPRRLFYNGLIEGNIVLKDSENDSSPYESSLYPYTGMWDHPTNGRYDLGFGMTDKIYWTSNQIPNQNLYELFYRNTIQNITDLNSRLLEGKFRLTPKDISTFDFRDIIFLLGCYWRVLEIKDYNPVGGDKLTDVTLIKLNNLDIISPEIVKTPVSNNSCPSDIVLVKIGRKSIYMSKSGIPITEDCCTSKGGIFKEGVCYIDYRLPSSVKTPISVADGPSVFSSNGNTVNSNGVKVSGKNIYVPDSVGESVLLYGDNISIKKNTRNVIAVGSDIYVNKSNMLYVGNTTIDSNGDIVSYFNLVFGARDDVRYSFPDVSNINIVQGARDSLRAPSFYNNVGTLLGGRDSLY